MKASKPYTPFRIRLCLAWLCALPGLIMACQDGDIIEEYIDVPGDTVTYVRPPEWPYTGIVSYTVREGDIPMSASLRGDSIYIYWPTYWQAPDSIAPVIELPAGAVITPANETNVPLKSGTHYRVTAQDGTTADYYLRLVINQPQPWFAFSPTVIYRAGSNSTFNGDYLIPDPALTRFSYISAEGVETEATVLAVTVTTIRVTNPAALTDGTYTGKLVSGIHTYTVPGIPIRE